MIPPPNVVPNAERFEPEPGNPGVEIRVIEQAVLAEMSLVHRPSYKESSVELRSSEGIDPNSHEDLMKKRVLLWL